MRILILEVKINLKCKFCVKSVLEISKIYLTAVAKLKI